MKYKPNTPDFYIYHLYKQYSNDLWEQYNRLLNKVNCKIGTAYGNFQISTKDIFSEIGTEDLKYKNVGYGKLQLVGVAVYFKDKNISDLYYKSKEIKKAVESFIIVVDMLNEDKQNNLTTIHKQHGQPKEQHSIIWGRITGYLN